LQSRVTLLLLMVIAVPLVIAVFKSLLKHQVPWAAITAGSEAMKPVQLS